MAIPFLQHLDLKSSAELRNALLHLTTEGDAVDAEGGIIFDNADGVKKLKYYNGSNWISVEANTDNYLDGASLSNSTLTLTRTGTLTDLTVDLSSLTPTVNDATITITAGTGLTTGGDFTTNQGTNETITINHANISRTDTTSTDAPAYGGTFEAVTGVTTNGQGHVTAIDVSTVTIPASDNTDINVNTTNLKARLAQLTGDVTITGDTIIIPGDLQVTGTTTTNNVETVSTSNGIIFEGNAADDNEVTLLAQTVTADRTIVLPDNSGTVALTSDLGTVITDRQYTALVGDADSIEITAATHGLGDDSSSFLIQTIEVSTGLTAYCDVTRGASGLVTLDFGTAPAANDIRVLMIKIG